MIVVRITCGDDCVIVARIGLVCFCVRVGALRIIVLVIVKLLNFSRTRAELLEMLTFF